jgi:hypothetical protein
MFPVLHIGLKQAAFVLLPISSVKIHHPSHPGLAWRCSRRSNTPPSSTAMHCSSPRIRSRIHSWKSGSWRPSSSLSTSGAVYAERPIRRRERRTTHMSEQVKEIGKQQFPGTCKVFYHEMDKMKYDQYYNYQLLIHCKYCKQWMVQSELGKRCIGPTGYRRKQRYLWSDRRSRTWIRFHLNDRKSYERWYDIWIKDCQERRKSMDFHTHLPPPANTNSPSEVVLHWKLNGQEQEAERLATAITQLYREQSEVKMPEKDNHIGCYCQCFCGCDHLFREEECLHEFRGTVVCDTCIRECTRLRIIFNSPLPVAG